LPNTDKQSLDAIALRTLNSIRQRSILHENSPISKSITASLGGYTIIPQSIDLSELENFMNKADQALYEAKSKGRNCIVILSLDK